MLVAGSRCRSPDRSSGNTPQFSSGRRNATAANAGRARQHTRFGERTKGVAMQKKCLLIFLLLFAGIAWSQTTSGSITGTVLDAQAAVIPGATVTALEMQQKFTFTVKTNESGTFVFTAVPPGTYTIKIEASGFKILEHSGVVLNANDKIAVGDTADDNRRGDGIDRNRGQCRHASDGKRRTLVGVDLQADREYRCQQPQLSRPGETGARRGQHHQPADRGYGRAEQYLRQRHARQLQPVDDQRYQQHRHRLQWLPERHASAWIRWTSSRS